jgi:hypothetical protein
VVAVKALLVVVMVLAALTALFLLVHPDYDKMNVTTSIW